MEGDGGGGATGRSLMKKQDILAKMWSNPQGDWKIRDFVAVADDIGLSRRRANSGSHWTFASPYTQEIKTVPENRPIKSCYVRPFVKLARLHISKSQGEKK